MNTTRLSFRYEGNRAVCAYDRNRWSLMGKMLVQDHSTNCCFQKSFFSTAKLIPLAYGIHKLQIGCVVEDDKVGVDFLEEEITKFEDLVSCCSCYFSNSLCALVGTKCGCCCLQQDIVLPMKQ